MKHIQIKVRGKESNGMYAITNVDGIEGETFYEEVQTLKRAKHFVKCWNGHDDLLEACKIGLQIAEWLNKIEHAPKQLVQDIQTIKHAIAKAEKK